MNTVYVVRNQHGLYLSKQLEWVDGADSAILLRTPHRDEAINTVFEISSRDIYVRAEAVACELNAKGNPAVDPIARNVAAASEADDEAEPEELQSPREADSEAQTQAPSEPRTEAAEESQPA